MDISNYSVEMLKVMAYDAMATIDLNQSNLQKINALIAQKELHKDEESSTEGGEGE